jgi:putative RecB family exonuclease
LDLVQLRHKVDVLLDDRNQQLTLFGAQPADLVLRQPMELVPARGEAKVAVQTEPSPLSPSQVRTFLACSAKWWFKYALGLPEPKTSSLALGLAVHKTLEVNFREKLHTREDLETGGMIMVFREFWREQEIETEFREDEDPHVLRKIGEELVAKYMDEAATSIDPAAVELDVSGEIAGVEVRGRIDLMDTQGRIVDVKTAARRPSGISPDYAFQLATYRQITPGASGEARLDTLVKTKTVQLVQDSYTVSEADLRATEVLYPLVQSGISSGLYFPNRQSIVCSRRHCAFWKHCEGDFGGVVKQS